MLKNFKIRIVSLSIMVMLILGASLPVFAAPTTADQYAQYSGTGWSYNSSSHNFIANNQLSNSVPYVILSYLRDMYSQLSFDNSGYGYSYSNNTLRGIDITGSGKTSGGLYNIGKLIGLLNTNLMSQFVFTTNANEVPLYSWKNFIDTNLYSWRFSNDDFIDNFVNGIASVNNNVAYIANQLYSDSSNNRSLINQAFHSIVTNLDILSDIDNNTDGLESINTDIKNNTGYIYTESQGIHSDTSEIKTINSNIYTESQGIHSDTSDIKTINSNIYNESQGIHFDTTELNAKLQTLTDNYNNIDWVSGGTYYGALNGSDTSYTTSNFYSKDVTFVLSLNKSTSNIYKVILPFTLYNANTYDTSYDVYIYRASNNQQLSKLNIIGINNSYSSATEFIFSIPDNYNTLQIGINVKSYGNGNLIVYGGRSASIFYLNSDSNDYYTVYDNALLFNINKLFEQAKFVFFDEDTIAAKKGEASKTSTVIDNFTGSGGASASVSDFSDVASGLDSLTDGFTGGASASAAFGVMDGNSDGWSWFSSETQNDMDNTGSNNRLLRSLPDRESSTPYLDSYYSDLANLFGIDIGE